MESKNSFGLLFTIFACLTSQVVFANGSGKELLNEALNLSIKDTETKFEAVNQRIEKCSLKNMNIDANSIKPMLPENISKQELGFALMYVSHKNEKTCVGDVVAKALLAASSAREIYNELAKSGYAIDKKKLEKIDHMEGLLSGNDSYLYKYQARFNALPKDAQKKIDSVEALKGSKFHVLKLLDELRPDQPVTQ